MTQGGSERVLFCLAWKVIPSRTKIPSAKNSARRNFPFQVEVVLQCVRKLWVVCHLKHVKWLRQDSSLRVKKTRKHIGIYAEKRRQKPIDAEQDKRDLIAKDAGSAPQ